MKFQHKYNGFYIYGHYDNFKYSISVSLLRKQHINFSPLLELCIEGMVVTLKY